MREKEEKDVYFFTGGAGGEGCKREREREKEILLNIFFLDVYPTLQSRGQFLKKFKEISKKKILRINWYIL